MAQETKTVAGAYEKLKSHEDLCAERYRAIHETLGEMKSDARTLTRIAVSVLLAMIGWMAIQLWNGQQAHANVVAQATAGVRAP